MTPEEYAYVKEIFIQAIELKPESRECVRDSRGGENESILQQVRSLLEHHVEETVLEESEPEDTVHQDMIVNSQPRALTPFSFKKMSGKTTGKSFDADC